MLNQSLRKFFLYFTLRETEVPPKHSDFSFVVSFRTFKCNTCKMSGDISNTLINGGNFVNNNFTLFFIEARRL